MHVLDNLNLAESCTLEFVYWQVKTFIAHFSSQCTYYKRSCHYELLIRIYTLVMSSHNKNFLIQRSNYITEVCLVLYELLVSKTGLPCNCFVDFSAINLLTTRAYIHAHCCFLLKLDAKLDLVIDHFM